MVCGSLPSVRASSNRLICGRYHKLPLHISGIRGGENLTLRAMIIEHEILEQIFEEEWRLFRIVHQLDLQGKDLWKILRHHWYNGNIYFKDIEGNPLKTWQIEAILREQDPQCNVVIGVTERGLAFVV